MELESKILSDIVVHMKYARYLPELNRRETWEEVVTRNKNMHLEKFPELSEEIEEAYAYVYDKKVLPSMRSMQFAGKPVLVNPARLYNCSFLPIEHIDSFAEVMFMLLSGCGVGYSVQSNHIDKLPEIRVPTKKRRYLVGDSIEGWADAVKVLLKAYFAGKPLPVFDFSDIRPKGALLITSGGKAPGPEPLKDCLHNIQKILDRKENGSRLRPIEAHDICCYIADAVLSGGIRRAAMIALFDIDDDDMLECKFGNWYELEPQRARANNSAVLLRHKITKKRFMELWEKIKASGSGEPGFFFTNNAEWGLNPCAEISLRPYQVCNLTEINVATIASQEDLNERARAASFIGTLQASYTNFHFLRPEWKTVTEKEALIGVSLTGIASQDLSGFDITEASQIVKEENSRVAKMIGINPSARCTTVKPSGTASLVLATSSGIHAWHNDFYIRRIRVNKNESIYSYLLEEHPELLEDDFFKPRTQAVISIPQKAPEGATTRKESALDLLNRVGKIWAEWVAPGHRKGDNKNNVSATISIKNDEWEEVGQWMWENRKNYTALSVLPYDDHTYTQAPFEDADEDTFNRMVGDLHAIDLTKIVEEVDNTDLQGELACAGGACEIV